MHILKGRLLQLTFPCHGLDLFLAEFLLVALAGLRNNHNSCVVGLVGGSSRNNSLTITMVRGLCY